MSKRQEKRRKRRLSEEQAHREPKKAAERTTTQYRDEQVVRSARANRFLMVRYFSAGIFFVNVYWLILSIVGKSWGVVLPILGFAGSGAVLIECMLNVSRDGERFRVGGVLYPISAAAYVIGSVVTLLAGKDLFFPFFSDGIYGVVLSLVCAAVELVIIVRFKKIREHTDKRYEFYEKVSAEAGN